MVYLINDIVWQRRVEFIFTW